MLELINNFCELPPGNRSEYAARLMYVIQHLIGINKYSGTAYQTAQKLAFDRVLKEICDVSLAGDFPQHRLVRWFNALVDEELQKLSLAPPFLRDSPFLTDLLDSHFLSQLNLNSDEDSLHVPEAIAKEQDDPAHSSNELPSEPLEHDNDGVDEAK